MNRRLFRYSTFSEASGETVVPVSHHETHSAGGAWGAQSVKRPTSAQVTVSQFVSLSPASGSVLTAQSGACF